MGWAAALYVWLEVSRDVGRGSVRAIDAGEIGNGTIDDGVAGGVRGAQVASPSFSPFIRLLHVFRISLRGRKLPNQKSLIVFLCVGFFLLSSINE